MLISSFRLHFAARYALRHLVLSMLVALVAFLIVFGLLYPSPFGKILGIMPIFFMLLVVDVICGPLLTLIVSSPGKNWRERWLDFGLIGAIQFAALIYGLYSVWVVRPVIMAYEVDRLVIVTANELQVAELNLAPMDLQSLPWWGVLRVNTRRPSDAAEFLKSVQQGLIGISPAQRPSMWLDWESAKPQMNLRVKPVSYLLDHRKNNSTVIQAAINEAGYGSRRLYYLPVTSSKTKEWVALLDENFEILDFVNVDGFEE